MVLRNCYLSVFSNKENLSTTLGEDGHEFPPSAHACPSAQVLPARHTDRRVWAPTCWGLHFRDKLWDPCSTPTTGRGGDPHFRGSALQRQTPDIPTAPWWGEVVTPTLQVRKWSTENWALAQGHSRPSGPTPETPLRAAPQHLLNWMTSQPKKWGTRC